MMKVGFEQRPRRLRAPSLWPRDHSIGIPDGLLLFVLYSSCGEKLAEKLLVRDE